MRRWDMSGPAVTAAGLPLSPGSPIQLENGIQVTFDPPVSGPGPVTTPSPGTFQSGDYWTIPARAATGQIEWPSLGGDGNAAERPTSIQVYRAPLACIHATIIREIFGGQVTEIIRYDRDDCRQVFSPLTALTPPAAIQAAHVTGISWVNDDIMTLDALMASGLTITLDRAPAPDCPLSGANVIVTLELPQSGSFNMLSTVMAFDAPVTLTASAITWRLQLNVDTESQLVKLLSTGLLVGADAQQWARMRIRLPGQMIYAEGPAGLIYLDGLALGQPGTRQDGVTPRIDLKLPSGAGVVASDFEGWLYLAPILQVGVYINDPSDPPDVTVMLGFLGQVTGWFVTGTSPAQVVSPGGPQAVIYVSYPVIADTTVTITVTNTDGSDTGVGSIVSVPATATILSGQSSVSVPIAIVGNPGVTAAGSPVVLSFNITASIALQIGRPSSFTTTTPLQVTGVPPRHLVFE